MMPAKRTIGLVLAFMIFAPNSRPDEPLTLRDAVTLTLERNPTLAAMQEAIEASRGRTLDAGAWANPELSFEIENLRFGDGPDTNSTTRAPDGTLLERSTESVSNSGFRE